MLKLCIYLIAAISVLGTAIIAPSLGAIYAHFPEVDPSIIKSLLTVPAFLVIPSSYFAIRLSQNFGKKNVLMFALFLYAFVGTLAGLMSNIYLMVFLRALLGISLGLMIPLSQSLPADFFEGHEKNVVITRQGSAISLGSMISIFIAGLLAAISWRYSFYTHLVALPILVLVYFYMPQKANPHSKAHEAHQHTEHSIEHEKAVKKRLPFASVLIIIAMGIFTIGMFGYFTNIAIILEAKNLGNAAIAGYVLTSGSLTSFIISFIFLRLKNIFGKYLAIFIPLSASLAYVIIYFAQSVPMLFVGAVTQSISVGLAMPMCALTLTNSVHPTQLVKAMSFYTISMFLGQFLSPIILGIIPKFPQFTEIGSELLPVSALYIVFLLFFIPFLIFKKDKVKEIA